MTELAFCRRQLKEAASRLAIVELFEKRLQELRPLNDAGEIQLSELKNEYRREVVCWELAFQLHARRAKGRVQSQEQV